MCSLKTLTSPTSSNATQANQTEPPHTTTSNYHSPVIDLILSICVGCFFLVLFFCDFVFGSVFFLFCFIFQYSFVCTWCNTLKETQIRGAHNYMFTCMHMHTTTWYTKDMLHGLHALFTLHLKLYLLDDDVDERQSL